MIDIEVRNISSVLANWSRISSGLKNAIATAIQRTGLFASGKVKDTITSGTGMWKPPIDTGAMRRGIQPSSVSMFEPKVFIRPSAATPYATFVHEGTKRMKARPFFTITKSIHETEIRSFFESEFKKLISSLIR